MKRGLDLILTLLSLIVAIYGWVTSERTKARKQRSSHRPFSHSPQAPEEDEEGDLATSWPDWAVGTTRIRVAAVRPREEVAAVEDADTPAGDVGYPLTGVVETSPSQDEDELPTELLKGIIWSEILQPPLALRGRR